MRAPLRCALRVPLLPRRRPPAIVVVEELDVVEELEVLLLRGVPGMAAVVVLLLDVVEAFIYY